MSNEFKRQLYYIGDKNVRELSAQTARFRQMTRKENSNDQERFLTAVRPATAHPRFPGDPMYLCRGKARDLGLLKDGSRSSEELAQATATHAPSLYRVLRLLTTVDLFTEGEGHQFALTPLGASLQTGIPACGKRHSTEQTVF